VGVVGALVYLASSRLTLNVLKVDDPLDAFAVHGACGMWGTLAQALLANPDYSVNGSAGLFYGSGRLLGAAVVGMLAITAWSAGLSAFVFFCLKRIGYLRVDLQAELVGLDVLEHGGDISVSGFNLGVHNTGADMVAPPSPSNSRHHVYSTDGSIHGVHHHNNLLDRFASDTSAHGASSHLKLQPSNAAPLLEQHVHKPHTSKSLSVHGASIFFTGRSTLRSGEVSGIAAHNKADIGANLKQVGEQTEVV